MALTDQEKQILDFAKQNGKSPIEAKAAIAKYRSQNPQFVTPQPVQDTSTVQSRLAEVGQGNAGKISDAISGQGQYEGQSALTRGIGATATAFNTVPQAAVAIAPEPVRNVVSSVGGAIGGAFKAFTDLIGSNKQLQEFVQNNPEATDKIMGTLQGASDLGAISGNILGAKGVADVGIPTTLNTASAVGNVAKNSADAVLDSASSLRKNVQAYVAGKNVNPQLQSSVERLTNVVPETPGVKGTMRLENPVQTYDKYLSQSKKALTDLREDPAISEVGSKIGDAFNTVVKQRQDVGKVIGEELKTVGKVRVPATEPKATLLSQLKDSGLAYNPKTGQLTSFTGSKFAPEETKMLQSYVTDFNKLGDNPTVSQIDNFISRKRTELEFTKGASGVTGTTNAERIIKGNLANLKDTLNPAKNGNKNLAKYWEANSTYSSLSDFLDEGQSFLGKKTQSGDFAKDASLAKSSVQSILNNGKKDWLIKLEGLTGYQALDNSVLALQAMKDAGDFRGLSLLQVLSEGAVPTSQAGFTQKAIDFAIAKGGQALAGTPEEQTRAFLNSLREQSQSTSPQIK